MALSCIASLISYYLWKRKRAFEEPYFYFSDLNALMGDLTPVARWAGLPKNLLFLALILFALACLDPRLYIDRHLKDQPDQPIKSPVEGIAIYLVLDQSGSMAETISSGRNGVRKVDLLRQVTRQFISGDPQTGLKGRPNDMIGLIAFARGAHVLSPLTLDHAALLTKLATFGPIGVKDQDGTSIGYAIFKTANMIAATNHYAKELIDKGEPAYTIKSTIMILITDGMQDPNPLDKGKRLRNIDVPEAAAYAKEQGVRLYIVNVEPKLATEEFSAYRHVMQRAAELTGGKFFMVDSTTYLEGIYRDIDQLEKTDIPQENQLDKEQRPDLYRRLSFYPFLIGSGLLLLFLSIVLESTLFRKVP